MKDRYQRLSPKTREFSSRSVFPSPGPQNSALQDVRPPVVGERTDPGVKVTPACRHFDKEEFSEIQIENIGELK
jgi:hypothetical protein